VMRDDFGWHRWAKLCFQAHKSLQAFLADTLCS
jgi:hypothetical protein